VTGMALTLAATAAVWWCSALSAQAEAGRLLLFLVMAHWALSLALLPALAALTGGKAARVQRRDRA